METNIAVLLEKCLEEFERFLSPANLARYMNEVSPDRWLDELGRLRVWAYNMCDDDEAKHLSLRYELRDASHLVEAISKTLQRLLGLLQDLGNLAREDEDSEPSLATSHQEDENENEAITDSQFLYQSLRRSIGSLYQVSMEISTPARHDLLLGVTMEEHPDKGELQRYIRMSFPRANPILYDRITVAMARQLSILKYRDQSQERQVSNGPDSTSHLFSSRVTLSDELPKLASDEIFRFNTRQGLAFPIPKAPEGLSVSISFRRSKCQYCGFAIREVQGATDEVSWSCHLFRDLMPYFCPFPDCHSPLVLYGSPDEWYSHVERSHCSSVSPYGNSTNVCTLCREIIKPPFTFKIHVQAHLEQIGLCVLAHHDPEYFAQVTSHNSDYNSYKMLHRYKAQPSNETLEEETAHKRRSEKESHRLSDAGDSSRSNRDQEPNVTFERLAYWQKGDDMDFDGLYSYMNSGTRDTESMARILYGSGSYDESRLSFSKEESSTLRYDVEDSQTIFGLPENTHNTQGKIEFNDMDQKEDLSSIPSQKGSAEVGNSNQSLPPSNARWTKLDRRLVSTEVLSRFGENFEVKSTYVVVARFLSKDELLRYAVATQSYRNRRLQSSPFYNIIDEQLFAESLRGGHTEGKSSHAMVIDETEGRLRMF